MTTLYIAYLDSELGRIRITGDEQGIAGIHFSDEDPGSHGDGTTPDCLAECCRQLKEYFAGTRRMFHLALHPSGTEFQQKVWSALQDIPYGQVVSYRDIAVAVGNGKAVRAVGGANGKNPVSIVVPCHRVIGSDGSLTGYGGGLWRKEWLLAHERRHLYKEDGRNPRNGESEG